MLNLRLFAAVAICMTGSIGPAYAYLDPGTGSMILQLLLGGVAGALVVGKLYWIKIKSLFSGKSADEPNSSEE